MSTTDDEVEAKSLGVYEPNPQFGNAIASLEDSKEDLLEELEKEIEFIYQQASYAAPDILLMRYKQLRQLMAQIEMASPEISRQGPDMGEPGMGGF